MLKKIQIRFYKLLLRLNGSVSNVVTFGELGKFPLRVLCKERINKYWLRLISSREGLRYGMYMCQNMIVKISAVKIGSMKFVIC